MVPARVEDSLRDELRPGQLTVWTIGHSTRSADEFGRILATHELKNLVDVRSFPGSRRYPHFNKERLNASLAALKISYHHLPSLGGRRRPLPDSKHNAWNNPSFRAYADHMETQEFESGIAELVSLVREKATAIMCAEALWWRCHRGLIADYLKASGMNVVHVIDETHAEVHPYTSAARIIDGRLSYEGLLAG